MTETTPHDLELHGCTPEPLMAYLKALGVLRLVSEQKDSDARGWWKNDVFWLRSKLNHEGLVEFFLEEYKPTPIVAPWGGGSGFFAGDNSGAVSSLCNSDLSRCKSYSDVILHVRRIIEGERITKKPKDEDKVRLIRHYRRELSDEVLAWMDAAMVVHQDGQGFAPLLGTGGNDGRLDFTQNFMQRIVSLGLHKSESASEESRALLEQALLGSPSKLNKASVGQFSPGRAGGPNATQGMEGDSTDNPWDFILMLEGTLLLAGAALRRLGPSESGRSAFPFTVRTVAAGFDSPASRDEAESRGELWLPLWSRSASAGEIRQLFGEGRAEVGGRVARNATDFARAAASLGVDRGIAGFSRVAFLKRSGKAFLATPLGRFAVAERSGVDLIREIDPWLDCFRRAARDKNAPPRFGFTLRGIDSAIFDFCKYGVASFFQKIIVALGAAERELATAERFRDKNHLRPIAGLSSAWIDAADDGSTEFMIAGSLSSLYDSEAKIGPFRANLESVDWKKGCRDWAKKERSVVWNAADLSTTLANVLQRRIMDAARAGCEHLALASAFSVPLDVVAVFLDGQLDDRRIEDLIWGLALVTLSRRRTGAVPRALGSLSRHYALLKLLFLPRALVAGRQGKRIRWRLARDGEKGIIIPPEPCILPLLRAGRVGEACAVAARRLRAAGMPPMPGPLSGKVRDATWSEYATDPRRGRRLAAGLLIPIASNSIDELIGLVCRDPFAAAEALAISNEEG